MEQSTYGVIRIEQRVSQGKGLWVPLRRLICAVWMQLPSLLLCYVFVLIHLFSHRERERERDAVITLESRLEWIPRDVTYAKMYVVKFQADGVANYSKDTMMRCCWKAIPNNPSNSHSHKECGSHVFLPFHHSQIKISHVIV